MEKNTNNKGGRVFMLLSAILLLLSCFLAWKLYRINSEKEIIVVERNKIETSFTSVKQEFDEIKNAFETLHTDNKALQDELDTKRDEIEELGLQLEKYKNDAGMVRKLKKELNSIRALIKNYLHDIDSLQQANATLVKENSQVTSDLKNEIGKNEKLNQEKNSLAQQIDLGARLKAYQINAKALKIRGSDKESETSKAKKADRIKACFTLSENKLAKIEDKTIYMKVIAPGEEVLVTSADDRYTFTGDGKKQYYSAKRELKYEQKAKDLCLSFTKKENDEYKAGDYRIEIYSDGVIIGTTTIELK